MAKQLSVKKNFSGEPAVKCPGCQELVQPDHYPIVEGYECPECSRPIEAESLNKYLRALNEYDEKAAMGSEE